MNFCSSTFFIALVFFVAMISTSILSCTSGVIKNYMNNLTPVLKTKYEKIRNERMTISLEGYVLGVFFSGLIIFYNYKSKKQLDRFSLACIVIATTLITNYLFYILFPKSQWMINYLNTKEEKDAWLNVYKHMQLYYHGGLLLGLIAVGFLSLAFEC